MATGFARMFCARLREHGVGIYTLSRFTTYARITYTRMCVCKITLQTYSYDSAATLIIINAASDSSFFRKKYRRFFFTSRINIPIANTRHVILFTS